MENENHVNNASATQNENNEKMGMADRFLTAMFLPKEYKKLLKIKTGQIVSYLAVLLLLISVIQYAIPAFGALAGMGGLKHIILNEIPEFSLKDGQFYLEEKLEQDDGEMGVYMLVDTEVDEFTKEDVPEGAMQAILVSKTNMLVYNNISGLGGIVQEDTFENYKELTITNRTIADMSWIFYIIIAIGFVFAYLMLLVKYLMSALFYAVMLYLLCKGMLNYEFKKMYKIALFAQSIGAIVVAVSYCIDSNMFMMAASIFSALVTVILMNAAIFSMEKPLENDSML